MVATVAVLITPVFIAVPPASVVKAAPMRTPIAAAVVVNRVVVDPLYLAVAECRYRPVGLFIDHNWCCTLRVNRRACRFLTMALPLTGNAETSYTSQGCANECAVTPAHGLADERTRHGTQAAAQNRSARSRFPTAASPHHRIAGATA